VTTLSLRVRILAWVAGALIIAGLILVLYIPYANHQARLSATRCAVQPWGEHLVVQLSGQRAGHYCEQLVADKHVGWAYSDVRGKFACSFQLDGASGSIFYDDPSITQPNVLCRGWGPGLPLFE
jgi:hypothetical protein